MSVVSLGPGIVFPFQMIHGWAGNSGLTIDAATEKVASIGRMYWNGRPASAKTVSSSGGAISFRAGTVTFADPGTSIDVGIQDVSSSSGPTGQPDGTFDVKGTLVGGGGGISANTFNSVAMSSGTKDISHGDIIAVVLDMTARAGTDSVVVSGSSMSSSGTTTSFPYNNSFTGGAWSTGTSVIAPQLYVTADDGTLGVIDMRIPTSFGSSTSEAFNDTTNPDERGLVFQVPFDCNIDSFVYKASGTAAASDHTITLYSSHAGSPAVVKSITLLAEQLNNNAQGYAVHNFTPEISLTKNTDYCLAVRANSTSNVTISLATLPTTNLRDLIAGGTTLRKATRNNGSGAFTEESPAVTIYALGVGISGIDIGGSATPSVTLMGQAVF